MKTVRRRHSMPFGAELTEDGRVHFRLWAPAAKKVDLCLTNGRECDDASANSMPMDIETGGWFRLIADGAAAGTRYRFLIDDATWVPDPASRFQPEGVHGPSEVIDPGTWVWQDRTWRGRPWEEAILYELHVGSFTAQGSFAAVRGKLDYLVTLGITAIELMPVAEFPGQRSWGYDGTYLYAPERSYGRPDDLKALIDAAHARNLMVFLDVVYNHFGPVGNYLHRTAPSFFTERHHTPWGAAINFDGEDSHPVRQFFIHNALYWLEEYHLDGLRLDAVHTMVDASQPDIVTDLAQCIRAHFGTDRHIHLMLENDHNAAHYLARGPNKKPLWYTAQWNDDIHHAIHVLLTAETSGYYRDYVLDPIRHLGRCLAEGFAYQGEPSPYRHNQPRGESSMHLPLTAFVSFLQNHDQVGNRAFGERIASLAGPERRKAALALLLLVPSPPLLFMGEEWGCTQPFAFFCDVGPELAATIVEGRREEFARFAPFRDPAARARIPSPVQPTTFARARLDWGACDRPEHSRWLALYRELIALRRRELSPRLANLTGKARGYTPLGNTGLCVHWTLGDESTLLLLANLGNEALKGIDVPAYPLLYSTHAYQRSQMNEMPPWSVTFYLKTTEVAP